MGNLGSILEHLSSKFQLVGLLIIVLAGLVPKLTGSGVARETQRMLVIGLLVIGILIVAGGFFNSTNSGVNVNNNVVNGNGNALGPGATVSQPREQGK